MTEARIGRVLVASLHQAIADLLPSRLEFYEHWLNSAGLRHGTIGLAPLAAVLSFLRQEGDAYLTTTARAGEYAAVWTVQAMGAPRRALIRSLPAPLRIRATLWLARGLVRTTYVGSRAIVRLRKGQGLVDIRGSIFCGVRESVAHPLCGFYAAAITRLFVLFNLSAEARVRCCRAAGGDACLMALEVRGAMPATERAAA